MREDRLNELDQQAEYQGGGAVCLHGYELEWLVHQARIVNSIQRLMLNAEEIVSESNTGRRFKNKMVYVADIQDVIDGRIS